MGIVLAWSSNYPATTDTIGTNFPTVSDGVHDVLASHVNAVATAVVGLEGAVGGLRSAVVQDPLSLSDGDVLIWSSSNSQFEAGAVSNAGFLTGSSYSLQTSADIELLVGGFILDPSTVVGTITFELYGILTAAGAGPTMAMRLYDMGPPGTPAAGVLRSTLTILNAAKGANATVNTALTPVASPAAPNEIDEDERMYELRLILIGGAGGDSALNLWSGLKIT